MFSAYSKNDMKRFRVGDFWSYLQIEIIELDNN